MSDKGSINDVEVNENENDKDVDQKLSQTSDGTNAQDPSCEYSKYKEEPEDNDGENRHPIVRQSLGNTVVLMVKAIIGSGILNLPMIFKTLGLGLSAVMTVLTIVINIGSVYLLMKAKKITQRYGFSWYAKITLGTLGTIIMKSAIIMLSFGTCSVYLKVFGNIAKTIVTLIIPEDPENPQWFLDSKVFLLAIYFIMMFLMLKDELSGLQRFSIFGFICVFIFLGCVIVVFIFKMKNGEIQPFTTEMLYPSGTKLQMFTSATALLHSYYFHANTFPIYLPLKPRKSKVMVKATAISIFISSSVYTVTGLLGFFMYRYSINDQFLIYLRIDLLKYRETNVFLASVIFIGMIAFFISALLSLPIVFMACKKNLLTLISFIGRKLFSGKKDEGKEKSEKLTESGKPVPGQINLVQKYIIIITAYTGILITAMLVDKIIRINSIVGSTGLTIVAIIAPAFFVLKLSKESICSTEKLLSTFSFTFGTTVLFTFIGTEIYKKII